MKDVLWVLGIVLVTGFGLVTWRIPLVRGLDLGARIAIAFAGGCVVLAVLMFGFALVHVPFTRVTLLIALVVFAALAPLTRRFAPPSPRTAGRGVFAAILALTAYGLLTARETCADLVYFWGPKGQRFYFAETIDVAFLSFPHYSLMHPDYPPLLPLVYAFAASIAHGFSWWGALFTMLLLLLATTLAFRGLAREALGDERASAYAVLLAALLAYGYARSMVAGAGEPMLLLFETIAIAALTFRDDGELLAAIALAGAAWTKVEGTAFVAIVVVAYIVTRRRVVRAVALAAPAIVLVGSWLLFAREHKFLDQYARAGETMHLENLGKVLGATARQASYGAFYLPWLAGAVPFAFAKNWRRAMLPLLVFGGLVASAIYFYLHDNAPLWWIESSAERVLLSALMTLLVAAAAASE
ncbi:MAG TPA: hypothetical protein VJZ76_04290 [Thermoanaerobaculia bacterium]|nr:hypothetical protein [Thermoanaerobaculia bacterium]